MEGVLKVRIVRNPSLESPWKRSWVTARRHELVYAPFDPTVNVLDKKKGKEVPRAAHEEPPIDLRFMLKLEDSVRKEFQPRSS